MALRRCFFAAMVLVPWLVNSTCTGNTAVAENDGVALQPGEIAVTQPPASKDPVVTTPGSQNPSQPPATPPVTTPAPQPPVVLPPNPPKEEPPAPPTQPPSPPVNPPTTPGGSNPPSPCPIGRFELPAGTWGAPDLNLNSASQSGLVHGDLVTSVGGGFCGTLLETRTRGGILVGRYYLPPGLMDYYTGLAKYPGGGFIVSGMRSVAPENPQSSVIQRMVVALVDEKANLIWKNDFDPEGPSQQNWGYSVITDKEGNSYVAANLNGFSVVKVGPKGERLWTYNYAPNSGVARALRFDKEGNVVATGYIDVNPQSFYGDRDVFVIKLSPKKKILWKHRVVSPTLDYAYDIALNAAGQVWVFGWSGDMGVKFKKNALHLPTTFLIKLESNGTRSGIMDVGAGGYTSRIEILPNQNIVLSGSSTSMPLTFNLLSPDGLQRLAEKTFDNPYWNILNFMVTGPEGEIYTGLSSGTPVGQPPAYAFGSIRKIVEADIKSH